MFSEYPLWIAFSFALFVTISEAIFGIPLRNALVLKHIPLLVFLPAFTLYIVGRTLGGAPRIDFTGWFSWLWPFLLLGSFATIGSLYARFILDVKETFLVLGIYMLLTPLFYIWGREVGNTKKIVRPFLFLWGVSSCVAVAGSIIYFGKVAVLHSIEFLVQPFFVYLFFVQKKIVGKLLALFLLATATILTQKLTGYINGISAISYIGLVYVDTSVSSKWQTAIRVVGMIVLVAVVGSSILGFIYFREYLPSGNMDVRLHQYGNVFTAFLQSPIWGQAYTAASGETYIEYTRSLNIPTHSDILDLLKEGGVVALGLWLIGIFVSIRLFVRCAMKNLKTAAFFHAMAFLAISIAVDCAVNPLFLTPSYAFIIWGSLALTLGVATDTRKGQFNES
ncbi:MAG: O-antigen ligase family protein [Rhodoferax sp.]|uniref:O-antigen ligase family protein n=1 Tax=Rhodoferax sp. TaxID=50421 RepID=UPI0026302110|nr:O-antigen ligase family protein [Rhodoferax sp.]MDD5332953.1 O-antigen ligase family protein [Rhodoferax sp.]